jgi:ribosomal protein L4
MRKLGLKVALSAKAAEGRIDIADSLDEGAIYPKHYTLNPDPSTLDPFP